MKSTHFRFRGPNNFLRVCIDFPKHFKSILLTPIRSMWTPRSIEVLKNDRKFLSVCVVFASWNRRIFVFGVRTICFGFAFIFLMNQNRLLDADLIDVDASIDRGGRNRAQIVSRLCFFLQNKIDASRFSGPEQFSSGLRWFCLNISNRFFWRRFDRCGRLDRSRCSKTVENSLAFALYLPNAIDACSFSGPEQFS